MSTYKRIDGDYVITTINSTDTVTINTQTVTINGNLDVVGNVTYIETTELIVDDPFITVAGNNSGTLGTATFQEQGLVAQTSSATWAGLRFNNPTATWQVSDNVYANGAPIAAYANLMTSGAVSPGGANTAIQFNDNGSFGGNTNFTFDYATARATLQGHQIYGNIGVAPTAVANSVAVYHRIEGAGGTGLYAKNGAGTENELCSTSKAIVFGIIF